jgi:hypothetical protein
MPNEPARRDEQRASDADREMVAEDLRDAFSEGRLDVDEYQRRLDAVWASATYGELDRLTADLPNPVQREHRLAEQRKKQRRAQEYVGEWKTWLGAAVIMIGIWVVSNVSSGEWDGFWPAWPLGIWAAVLLGSALWPGEDKK